MGLGWVFVEVLLHMMTLLVLLEQVSAKQTFIVQMKPYLKPESYNTHNEWYTDLFHSATSSFDSKITHTYEAAYSGFAASISPDEVESLRKSESVLGVYPDDKLYNLHTTRTPQFLGLITDDHTLDELNKASEDVIIGVLDMGVRPESESFRDVGDMPPVPARWNGTCGFHNDPNTTCSSCNNKLIGARNFVDGGSSSSPRVDHGHGSHTASIAAGSEVANVSFSGNAGGNARGVAFRARLAAYKVATESGAYASDILAGIDAAILDGVDVLSLSLGTQNIPSDYSYDVDPIASGAFAAMEKGIFVSCSAGNGGPVPGSVVNVAPWVVTAGAGTIDRDFPAFGILGDGTKFRGVSMYVVTNNNISSELLAYGGDCSSSSLPLHAMIGKVVICDDGGNNTTLAEKVDVVMNKARGKGMILVKSGDVLHLKNNFFPMLAVGDYVGDQIKRYVASVENPTVVQLRFGETDVNVKPSPLVVAFSSRGPNLVTPQILKPDVIGPGVNVLGAWTNDNNMMIASGTSMLCPHISGVAALVKGAHPEWSPSAVKSAMMTTAYTLDDTNSSIRDAADAGFSAANPLAYGAGHVDPQIYSGDDRVRHETPEHQLQREITIRYRSWQSQLSLVRRGFRHIFVGCELHPRGDERG